MPEDFASRIIQVQDGNAELLSPTTFSGHITEARLEEIVLGAPEALGEELFVLGHQLADFSEDKQRLDVLAIDKSGEIVLIELKVEDQFGLTDVQAIAYAGGYADLPTSHYAETLERSLQGPQSSLFRGQTGVAADATIDEIRAAIAEFLGLGTFDDWDPSQKVRIKLVAPGFTQRVLKNVKWLGDVYGMPIEAIRAQLFEANGTYQVSFARLLPLAGDETFGLTVRDREVQRRAKNEGRRRRERVFPLLIDNGHLKGGDRLWLIESALKANVRHLFDPDNEIFSGEVQCSQPPKLLWRSSPEADAETISPASLAHRVCEELLGSEVSGFGTPVAVYFTLGKGGPTLREIATEHGLWSE